MILRKVYKIGEKVSNLRYSPSSPYFYKLRKVQSDAQSLFHRHLDRILTHLGDNQRLGNSIRGCNLIYYPLINLV